MPCVTVTICQPGTSTCQSISNILLDTGSFGLRIFGSVISPTLTPISCNGSGTLAECVTYGDGSSDWGPVETAKVTLAGEPSVTMPIQVINQNFSGPPSQCTAAGGSNPDLDADSANSPYNGILGVGPEPQDCGSLCATSNDVEQYYCCSGSSCSPILAPTNQQVTNPVSVLPTDNNGVILTLPSLTNHQATSIEANTTNANGGLYFGIGTQTNNIPATTGLNILDAAENDSIGNDAFSTQFNAYGTCNIPGFIDSGSSALFVPPPADNSLPDCSSAAGGSEGSYYEGLYCPTFNAFSLPLSFTATNFSLAPGSSTNTATFYVNNAFQLLTNDGSMMVFDDFTGSAGTGSDAYFDWGLPFFFGRTIYVGIDGTTNQTIGTGPYWAY